MRRGGDSGAAVVPGKPEDSPLYQRLRDGEMPPDESKRISADELRQFAFLAGASRSVIGADITEIDSAKDSEDERTVRLAALAILEMIAGFSTRS